MINIGKYKYKLKLTHTPSVPFSAPVDDDDDDKKKHRQNLVCTYDTVHLIHIIDIHSEVFAFDHFFLSIASLDSEGENEGLNLYRQIQHNFLSSCMFHEQFYLVVDCKYSKCSNKSFSNEWTSGENSPKEETFPTYAEFAQKEITSIKEETEKKKYK